MKLVTLKGGAIAPHIDDLARLRIAVFRAFPYLYEGSLDYEARYLATYAKSQESVFGLALDGERVVGAATGMPLRDETGEVKAPFREKGWPVEAIFYYGESVLLPDYRGRGIGVGFFEAREAFARSLGRFSLAAFCAVRRPPDHPRRPDDYVPLDAFWKKRGFTPHPELETRFSWRDLDEPAETEKPMSFWIKPLE